MTELAILPRIKVCGVRDIADVARALAGERVESPIGLDAIGFVTWEKSPRCIEASAARRIIAMLSRSVLPVAVMVDTTPASAEDWARASGVRAVQLCGAAKPAEWRGFALPIFRRVGVDDRALQEIETWTGIAAAFVLDHPDSHGGSGRTVDLDVAAGLAARAPCLLAGGLDADNVAACIERVRPFGVDASSRLESAPGRKDPERVRTFVLAAAAALAAAPATGTARSDAAPTHERRSEP